MAIDKNDRLVPSILDRLVDADASGTVAFPGYSLGQMLDAVKRDLHELLNTHQSLTDKAAGFERVRRVLGYGLPDLISSDAAKQTHQEIAQQLEATVQLYEPRLRDIRVQVVDPKEGEPLKIRFRLTAQLAVEPNPEVAVDTILQLSTGYFVPGN